MVAASIRFNNPGAMWGNALARKWGAEPKAVVLADGLGQGNNIAVFPTKIQGACAQFDLWRTSYCNLTLEGAIKKWSGGNSSIPYMEWLTKRSGIAPSTIITPLILNSKSGLELIKAQAWWEAGKEYPLSDPEWVQAQAAVFRGVPAKLPMSTKQKKTATVVAGGVATAGAVTKAASDGHHWLVLIAVGVVCLVSSLGIWYYFHYKG